MFCNIATVCEALSRNYPRCILPRIWRISRSIPFYVKSSVQNRKSFISPISTTSVVGDNSRMNLRRNEDNGLHFIYFIF